MPTTTYRADPFMDAARRMNLEVVVGSDFCKLLAEEWDIPLSLRLRYVSQAVDEIADYALNIASTPSCPSTTIPPKSPPGRARS